MAALNRRRSLRALLLWLVAAACAPLGLLLAYNMWADARRNLADTQDNLLYVAEEVARRNGDLLGQLREQLVALAQRPRVAKLDPNDCDTMIAEGRVLLQRLANVLTLDAEGRLVCSAVAPAAGRPRAVDPRYFLDELRRTRAFTIGTPARGFITGRWVVTLAQPIFGRNGEVTGVVAMAIDLHNFWTGANALVPLPGGRVRIFDERGVFVASSDDPQRWIGEVARSSVYTQVAGSPRGTMLAQDRGGESRLYGYAAIPGTRWYAVASVSEVQVLRATRAEVLFNLGAALAASAVALLLAFLVARAIARPVERTASTVTAVASGDLAARVPISGPREVAQMADQFNAMLGRLEQSRREIESLVRRQEALLQNVRDVILVSDGAGLIVEANTAAAETYGRAIDDLRGRPLADLCAETHRNETMAAWGAAVDAAGTLFEAEHLRADGSIFPVEVSARATWIDGRLTVLSSVRDISLRRQADDALRAAKEAADAASMAKSEFLANMSHEIRTPLTSILGLAQLLGPMVSGAEAREMVGRIRNAGTLLLRTLNDVLDLSKMEAGQLRIAVQPFRVGALLRHAEELVEPEARSKGVTLRTVATDCASLDLIGDATRIEQVLLNLLANAVKFSDEGEVLLRVTRVEESEHGVRLRFEISDQGIGIAGDKLASLFTPFTQIDGGLARRFGGTGLGLSICKRLVELMGGSIGVDSVADIGSTFWFEIGFPRAGSHVVARQRAEDALHASGSRLSGCRVLVVDDSPMNLDLIARVLRREGARATLASDGLRALELLGETPSAYDVVLMDLQMPVVDGLAATRAIRSDAELHDLPIIAWSAGVFEEDRAMAMSAGASDFVAKPFDLEALIELIRRWAHREEMRTDTEPQAGVAVAVRMTDEADALPDIAGIDRAQVERLMGRHRDAFFALVADFVADHADTPELLGAAIARGDRDSAAATLHQLRGTAAYLGATGIVAAARALEAALRTDQPDEAELATLKDAFDRAFTIVVEAARAALGRAEACDANPDLSQSSSVG